MRAFLRNTGISQYLAIVGALALAAVVAALVSRAAEAYGMYEIGVNSFRIAVFLLFCIVLYSGVKLTQHISRRAGVSPQLTASGAVFLILILLVAILSLSSGNNLLYLVLSLLLATMFVSLIGSRLSLSGVRVGVRLPNHIFAGETVRMDVKLFNRKRMIPSFSIGVDATEEGRSALEGEGAMKLAYLPIIPPKTECRARIDRVFDRRGVLSLKGFTLGTRFPLGFIEQRRFIEAEGDIVIYPAPAPPEEVARFIEQSPGRVESRLKGAGSDLYAIRPYQASDHHHHIDWKSTAKTGALMVREFTRDDDWRATIILENRVSGERFHDEQFHREFEKAVALSAGLIKFYGESGAEVRLAAGEADSGYGAGPQHYYSMLRLLALIKPVEEEGAEETDSEKLWEELDERLTTVGFKILLAPYAVQSSDPGLLAIEYGRPGQLREGSE